jgi:hypothetical protein
MINQLERFAYSRRLWFALSLAGSLYFGIVTLLYVLHQPYIVQDDARQHVVFLQRLVETRFSQDLIADYFTAIAPAGYKLLYWSAAKLGISPLAFAKLLPLGLSLITTAYVFFVCLELLPVPLAGFLATLILNQLVWLKSDLVSATPRAFVYPIFAAFLYYLLQRSLFPCLFTILLQGLFFPQLVFIQVFTLLIHLFSPRSNKRFDYRFAVSGVLVAGFVLLPYALNLSAFGKAITAEQMRLMPEYGSEGRNQYFGVSAWRFWLLGNSGIRIPWFPSLGLVGFGLPLLQNARQKFPLVQRISPQVKILWQVLLASGIMYGLAHLLLLKLHFPSRYTYHTLRIVLAMAAAIVLTVLIDAGWRWLRQVGKLRLREALMLGFTGIVAATVIIVPAVPPLFLQFQGWIVGNAPALYRYLAAQPSETLVASLAQETNSLPAFAKSSTLVGREFALPHHPRYYNQFKQRTIDLIQAQYSSKSTDLIRFIDQYGIDFILLEPDSFSPDYLLNQDWLIHSSFQNIVLRAVEQLRQGNQPALISLISQCRVISELNFTLVDASCIKTSANSSEQLETNRSFQQRAALLVNQSFEKTALIQFLGQGNSSNSNP